MTKQQPCASKLRLSKICRWLIALGIAKLALFGAWSVDMPLQQPVTPDKHLASTPATTSPVNTPGQPPADAAGVSQSARDTGEVRLAALFAERLASTDPKASAVHLPDAQAEDRKAPAQTDANPAAGALAVRSAAPLPAMPVVHLPWSKAARAEAEAASAGNDGERPLASGVDADGISPSAMRETSESTNSWWREILTLTRLPVPVLGVRQIAHAASLDMPPPTVRPSAPGTSPFAPPEQAQVRPHTPTPGGQASPEPPLPLRPRPNAPQTGTGTSALPTPAVQTGLSADAPERKQQELARREQDVLMLKQQMESRLQELQTTEKKVQGMLKEAHGVHDQKIKHLISAYTSMKPKQAALALESLDERLAVRILAGMNPKQAGEVLTYTNPQKVAKLSELLARMQIPGE